MNLAPGTSELVHVSKIVTKVFAEVDAAIAITDRKYRESKSQSEAARKYQEFLDWADEPFRRRKAQP